MSLDSPARPIAPDAGTTLSDDTAIWLHAAFCSLALPLRATREAWRRDTPTASIRIEPVSDEEGVPSGRLLRLSLMHICNVAFRADSPVVELAENLDLLAAVLGMDPKTRDLAEQWQRLLGARIQLSWGGGAEFSVFDARSRRRAGELGWRSSVRLTGRFLASLRENAVPLDRRVVRELSAAPAALDAYAWIRLALRQAATDQIVTTTWDDLLKRFGTSSQDVEGFREAFETALRMVFDADRSIALAVDDEGVSIRHAAPEDDELGVETKAAGAAEQSDAPIASAPTQPVAAAATIAESTADDRGRADPQEPDRTGERVVAAAPADRITQDSISLPRHLTGLAQVIWLRRGHGEESVLVGVTPSPRFEAERLTVLAVEPMVIQVSGGLNEKDFERVSAWVMTNRDVIDEFWEGGIHTFDEINRRVRKAPPPGWR